MEWDGSEMAQAISNGKSHATSSIDCSCGLRTAMLLPCEHFFAVRQSCGLSKYDPDLFSDRWCAKLYSHKLTRHINHEKVEAEVLQVDRQQDVKFLSAHQTYKNLLA